MNDAVFLHGPRDVRVAPFNLREGQSGETLIDVAAVGICGSDLHYYKDGGIGSAIIHDPFIPGHEFGGRLRGRPGTRAHTRRARRRRSEPLLRTMRMVP